jgi:nitrogen regulatory protein PII
MKLIVAVIQPSRFEAVTAALAEVEVFRVTVTDVQGYGRQRRRQDLRAPAGRLRSHSHGERGSEAI